MTKTIYTIGHSNHPGAEFVAMLQAQGIEQVADVRTIPRSRHNPQFNTDELERTLRGHGIAYVHLKELGGLRRTTAASINTAWKNASFRGFADYMQTPEFEAGLQRLIDLASERRTTVMCAEAVPWRCHRSLIGDALTARHIAVKDIMSKTSVKPHTLTPWAKVDGQSVTYPGL